MSEVPPGFVDRQTPKMEIQVSYTRRAVRRLSLTGIAIIIIIMKNIIFLINMIQILQDRKYDHVLCIFLSVCAFLSFVVVV